MEARFATNRQADSRNARDGWGSDIDPPAIYGPSLSMAKLQTRVLKTLAISHVALWLVAPSWTNAAAIAQKGDSTAKEAAALLSPTFRACFGKDAPLDATSYGCLDREYHRLDALLTAEYRAALARQADDASRKRIEREEQKWLRTRFRHCREEVGDFRGATAAVINENCEIDTLAQRIVRLRR